MASLGGLLVLLAFLPPLFALLDLGNVLEKAPAINATKKEINAYKAFAKKFKKNYGTPAEIVKRFKIFRDNLKELKREQPNALAKGYSLGENKFTDMTSEERAQYVMPADLADETDAEMKKVLPRAKRAAAVIYPGETIDWRFTSWMPAVRNQGSCGSCYAFAAINAIEVQWNWLGHSAQFSEQQIVDCAGSNNGCNGGWPEKVFNYSYVYGNAARTAYPYTGVKGTCYNTARTMTVSTWYQLTSVSQMESYNYYYGPIAFSIYVPNSLYSYSGGIFYPTQSTCSSSNNVGAHAMTIVGYGTENGVPYWIIRNSWGADWGEGGYFRMRKSVNNCGMETRGVFFPWCRGNTGATGK